MPLLCSDRNCSGQDPEQLLPTIAALPVCERTNRPIFTGQYFFIPEILLPLPVPLGS